MEYLVTVPVTEASGHQFFTVVADSPEEAIRKVKEGIGNFEEEEITADLLNFRKATAEENV